MSEWWTYTVADFMMFSARTYYRLIEHYNRAWWPFHLLAAGLGVLVIGLILRAPVARSRTITGVLALLWAWVAMAFLWHRFSAISTGAAWFAAAFGAEALLLVFAGVMKGWLTFENRGAPAWLGLALLTLAVAAYPFTAVVSGRGWAQGEVFGMMPDPTALGTIGALMMARGRWRRRLLVLPVLWCLLSAATLWALSTG
jgi:hypothetical protein